MTTLNDIAPWPDEDEVTAESLLKHFTAAAFVHEGDTHELSRTAFRDGATAEDKRRYADAANALVARFGEVLLLRALVEAVPDKADGIARRLWGALTDGSVIPELLWDWLTEHNVDPEQVVKLAAP